MISYEIPLERYPKTYNRQPLSYIALAAHLELRGWSEALIVMNAVGGGFAAPDAAKP